MLCDGLNKVGSSFLGLLGDDSPLLDLDLLDVLAEAGLDGLDDVGLVGLEGVEVSPSSNFELGDLGVLLDEDGYVRMRGYSSWLLSWSCRRICPP